MDVNYIRVQAGMFAIRARRKVASERDFLDAVEKVVRQGTKFSSTYVLLHIMLMCYHLTVMLAPDRYIKFTTRCPVYIVLLMHCNDRLLDQLNDTHKLVWIRPVPTYTPTLVAEIHP